MSYRRLLACLLALSLFLSNLNSGLINPGYAESIQNAQEATEMQGSGETTIPSAQPEPTPEVSLFGENASYNVQVTGGPLAAGAELTVRLESRMPDDPWTAVAKPDDPGEEFRLTLLIGQTGETQAVFPLEGLPYGRALRVRVLSGRAAGGQALSYTAVYSDRQLGEDSFATLITLETAASEPAETPLNEPPKPPSPR